MSAAFVRAFVAACLFHLIPLSSVRSHGRFDVLVTNPPYSRDHVLKLLDFAASRPEPHLLCMPSYVMVQPDYECGTY